MASHRSSYGKRPRSHSDYDDDRGSKRRNPSDDKDQFSIDAEDTVFRYLCPVKLIGSIIGRGGEIVKQLRVDTNSKIRIGETVRGSEERVITIYSSSYETNGYEDKSKRICPAQDALFRVHDRIVSEKLHGEDDSDGVHQVTVRLLVPSDQIGCVIGKGGQIVQNIRSETGCQIRILKDEHLPSCALSSDELIQISGEAPVVKKGLYLIASRLHENPSRTQHLLVSAVPSLYPSGSLIGPTAGAQFVGIAPMMSPYGGYKGDSGEWHRSLYSAPRDGMPSKEFSLRLVSPVASIGGVIGKGGAIINQIRQESGAAIKVDSSATEGDDCLITISAKEMFENNVSPTIQAAVRLHPKCSDKVERDSGIISYTTRLLVPTSRIGCLIGKGGAIITEMRRLTKANIRILSKEDLPKIASDDEEMVQISGELDVTKEALVQVTTRLRANLFDREGAPSTYLPVLPYLPAAPDASDRMNYDSRDSRRLGRVSHSFSGGYGPNDISDSYGAYGSSQIGRSGSPYGSYGGYSSGRSGPSGLSSQSSLVPRRKSYGY